MSLTYSQSWETLQKLPPHLRITVQWAMLADNHKKIGRSNWTNWVFATYLLHKTQQKLKALPTKNFCLLSLLHWFLLWNVILFPATGGFFPQLCISCFAIVTAVFMANPKHNVFNQFSTQTTLHRHYRDSIFSSIKMIHNLFWVTQQTIPNNHLYYKIWNRSQRQFL